MSETWAAPVGSRTSGPAAEEASTAAGDAPWTRPALGAILVLAAALYGWGLPHAATNSFYSAAAYSAAHSWKAWFYGSLDPASFITVDKPPLSTMAQGLSVRVFGMGTWQMVLPSVLAGVGSVAVLHGAVRRAFGRRAGLVAALVLALTPITVAITRDNNPDPLMMFLTVCGLWALVRLFEDGRWRWALLFGAFFGLAFLAKMLQAFVPLPALVGAYLYAGPGGWWRRVRQMLAAGGALVVAGFWWPFAVDLTPAASRPYIGGSGATNSAWNLVIGYNGLSRVLGRGVGGSLTGGRGGGFGGGPAAGSAARSAAGSTARHFPGGGKGFHGGGGGGAFGGGSGLGRMFEQTLGGQISWLLPLAAVCLVGGLVLLGRHATTARTATQRGALIACGGWTVLGFAVFSFMNGTMHPYYTTLLAPGIAGTVAIGGRLLVRACRASLLWALVTVAGLLATAAWAIVVLQRTPDWQPWLTPAVALLAVVGTVGVLAGRPRRRMILAGAAVGLAATLLGPAAYAVDAAGSTATSGQGGSNPLAGPATGRGGFAGGGIRIGNRPGAGTSRSAQAQAQARAQTQARAGRRFGGGAFGGGAFGGGFGGGRDGGTVSAAVVKYLTEHRDGARWILAVGTSQQAAQLILSTHQPVVSMFGFTGSDSAMTASRMAELARSGELRYVELGGGRGGNASVDAWVQAHGTKVDVAGTTLYRLS
ncbi:ArnT family glycosyltransferase [Mangrovactinospora gilvigrisea]|uniref:ArnT family glycosyltransferase n=1 Tax=Mangrovactinospora gilvigrisea TaxID=1428644 RepID=UPI000A4DED6E|nr:glycosyltransferase family 39 protein [Mangrovactinospora gilvigrisea]